MKIASGSLPDRLMTNHIIWAAGLLGHFLLLGVLLARKRTDRFRWFTLLIVYYLLRSMGQAAVLGFSGHAVHGLASILIDATDVLLQLAVLAELIWIALRPLNGLRQLTLPLLLLASGVLIVMRLAPTSHFSLRMALVLTHFLLSVLMVEWAITLGFLLRPLRLSWRSHVAGISFGFGFYSLALLGGGGYFTTGREMSDYVFFAFFRISVYLLVLLWWIVCLWMPQPE